MIAEGRIHLEAVIYQLAKAGNAERDWEDGAGFDVGDPATGRPARFVVSDGATDAYDSIRWAHQLVTSLLGESGGDIPALTREEMVDWLRQMQERWVRETPSQSSWFEATRLQDGSFATLLACQLDGLGEGRSTWSAVALGDAVLFHVRDGVLHEHFPPIEVGGFGTNPDGAYTRPDQLGVMRDRIALRSGRGLRQGDRLFLATDAMADWMLRESVRDGARLWRELGSLEHPDSLRHLVDRAREAGDMKNDDVTLVRVDLVRSEPVVLGVCR